MPHFRVEYSANLQGKADIAALCVAIHKTIMATGLFELGAVRVRAFQADDYAIADLLPDNAFVDMEFRVGQGRSAEDLKNAGEAIFKSATDILQPLFATPHFALSLEIRTIDQGLSWKKNAMHARLR